MQLRTAAPLRGRPVGLRPSGRETRRHSDEERNIGGYAPSTNPYLRGSLLSVPRGPFSRCRQHASHPSPSFAPPARMGSHLSTARSAPRLAHAPDCLHRGFPAHTIGRSAPDQRPTLYRGPTNETRGEQPGFPMLQPRETSVRDHGCEVHRVSNLMRSRCAEEVRSTARRADPQCRCRDLLRHNSARIRH